jgi:hypothetical protein
MEGSGSIQTMADPDPGGPNIWIHDLYPYTLTTTEYFQAKDMADAVVYILSAPPHMQIHDILVRPTQQTF